MRLWLIVGVTLVSLGGCGGSSVPPTEKVEELLARDLGTSEIDLSCAKRSGGSYDCLLQSEFGVAVSCDSERCVYSYTTRLLPLLGDLSSGRTSGSFDLP